MRRAFICCFLMSAVVLAAGCSSSREATDGAGTNRGAVVQPAGVSASVDSEASVATKESPVVINESLMGVVGVDDLRKFGGGWFDSTFAEYEPDPEAVSRLSGVFSGVKVKCFFGSWCSDSKREVPRFFRVLKEAGLSDSVVTLIGVDRQKFSLDGSSMIFRVERVPTFIFFRNGAEVGRIVETPHESLERDMLKLLGTNNHE